MAKCTIVMPPNKMTEMCTCINATDIANWPSSIAQAMIYRIKWYWGSKANQCSRSLQSKHDDVIKWEHFPRYWPFVRGIHRSPVNFPHKGQWRWAFMFLRSLPVETVKQTIETLMIWYAIVPIMTSLLWHTITALSLTHSGRDKIASVFQTLHFLMKIYEFRLRFHRNLFVRLTINNIPTLVKIMALRQTDDIRSQWVKLNISTIYTYLSYQEHTSFQAWLCFTLLNIISYYKFLQTILRRMFSP